MNSSAALGVVRVPVIVGPTGAGKSEIALAVAEEVGAVIVSADSRQAYRRFDIGTAKPTPEQLRRVPHRGIDVVDPTERLTAPAWAALAGAWIDDAWAAGAVPLVVGGTGFYVRALFTPIFDGPELDDRQRRDLDVVLSGMPVHELRRWAQALDPERAHLGRTQLLRAIETALLTGQRLSTLQRRGVQVARFAPRYLVVDPGRALGERLARRVDAMLAGGWVAEVQALMGAVPLDASAWSATGYDNIRQLVAGRVTLEEARNAVLIATRQYAKRQRTWFRHQLADGPVTHVDPHASDALRVALDWVRAA